MDASIQQTTTRPASEDRLHLEITLGGGVIHHYEIGAAGFYRALAEILRTEKPPRVVVEPVAPASSFDPVGNAS